MLDPVLDRILRKVGEEDGPQPDFGLIDPPSGRALLERNNRRWNVDLPDVARADTIEVIGPAGPVRVRVLVPEGAHAGAILFAHGGGFVVGSPELQERLARVLAVSSGLPVLSPDYRLAPEHPYPAALEDVCACIIGGLEAARAFGAEAGPLVLAGESAGANLVLAAALGLAGDTRADIAGALLFCGPYATDFDSSSYLAHANGPGLTRERMQRFWYHYLGDRDLAGDPLACPLSASDEALAALPPLYLVSAGLDVLRSDTEKLKARLDALGRAGDRHVTVPGVVHAFLQFSATYAPSRVALEQAGEAAKGMVATYQRR